ncbi:hypothetical protein HCQ94_05310 [Actinomyces sp. zg-332]|uniref:hypothetical protein n=1 Tax=Actinomyces sp. zg-332 TaxID=2708340 RepID=UPI00141FFF17|nr:hypothetical protein [Actinomyces sp. zg-332]QPK93988.1 hypothetical protein HCQ94_05310 [Actinomyces sp. zg-332]
MRSEIVDQWQKIDGEIVTKTSRTAEITAFLRELNVLACLTWDNLAPSVLSISLLENEGKIAGSLNSADIVPVIDLKEIVETLGEKFNANVDFDDYKHYALANEFEEGVEINIDVSSKVNLVSNSVLITRTPASVFPYLANLDDTKLGVVELSNDRRAVLQSAKAVTGLSNSDETPYIVFYNDGGEYYFVYRPSEDYEDLVQFTWDQGIELICANASNPDETILDMVKQTLSPYSVANDIAAINEDINVENVIKALSLNGPDGSAMLMAEFGLSNTISQFLSNETDLYDVAGITVHEPRGYTNAIGRSFATIEKKGQSNFWKKYRSLSFEKPWILNIFALGIGAIGAILFTNSLRKEKPTFRSTVSGFLGILLVLEGIAEYMLNQYIAISEESDRRENNDW